MSYYIQTQEAPLPYIYRTYKTLQGARKGAITHLRRNQQPGAIEIRSACYSKYSYFYRTAEYGDVTEEIINPITYKTIGVQYRKYA